MLVALRRCLMLTLLAVPVSAVSLDEAQAGCRRNCRCRNCCCQACQQPRGQCVCPTAAVTTLPQTTFQPVVETQYAQQPVLQQRDVPTTEYRTEPVTETIPSTIYENVMVDEGSYQSVWVPRMTTKSVARTIYQTRTAYRTVPYQTTRRISEYATQTIPYQSVRYVPNTTTTLAYTTPGYLTPGVAYNYPLPGTVAVAPLVSAPSIASSPVPSSTVGPVPDPRFLSALTTPVTPRSALTYEDRSAASDTRATDRGPSLFSPAPSAAQVWRTPRGTVTR